MHMYYVFFMDFHGFVGFSRCGSFPYRSKESALFIFETCLSILVHNDCFYVSFPILLLSLHQIAKFH